MEIIPVIDLMGGIVVHAQGGERKQYRPLLSVLSQHTAPEKVIADMLDFYPFKTLYIADLDALSSGIYDVDFYQQLSTMFPQLTLLLDVGIQTQKQWHQLNVLSRIKPIIASESLRELELLRQASNGILSLDFQNSRFLGQNEILHKSENWPSTVIVMNLDIVGAQGGPDRTLLQQLKIQREDVTIIAAGGVRNLQDLNYLKQGNITKVLVASALHNGSLDRESIQMLQK